MTSPADGASVWSGHTLQWEPHTGVSVYDWQADTSASFNSPALQQGSKNYINSANGNSDTEHFLNHTYFGTTYYWRVRARNAVDTCSWSTTRSILIRDYVTLTSPADGSLNRSTAGITLDWNSHHGISAYELQLDSSYFFNSPYLKKFIKSYINTVSSNLDTRESTGFLADSSVYFWRVRALNAVDSSEWTTWAFSTGNTPIYPSTPTLISPANGTDSLPLALVLEWSAIPEATGYEYQYDESTGFLSPVTGMTNQSQALLNGLNVKTTYYWRARSLNGPIPSGWSSAWSFTTGDTASVITVAAITGAPFCTGDTIFISFSVHGNFNIGNSFMAQLSDSAGSFSTPTVIGTWTGITGGIITGIIPGSIPAGAQYRIRVVSNDPMINGLVNNEDITINTLPEALDAGSNSPVCVGNSINFTTPSIANAAYLWSGPNSYFSTLQNPVINSSTSAETGDYMLKIIVPGCPDDSIFISVEVDTSEPQHIPIIAGWNMISSYVEPENPNILDVITDISTDVLLIKNGLGLATIPTFGINGIGDWKITEGYKLKSANDVTLTMRCKHIYPSQTTINLPSGWNLISYLRKSAMDAATALDGITDNILLVKDVSGHTYIPSFSINGIGDFVPGQGYKIKMSAPDTLIYPPN